MAIIKIKVPSSSANLGPGFDVFGLALKSAGGSSASAGQRTSNALLELHVSVLPPNLSSNSLNCKITCEGQGAEYIRQAPDENLITQVALYVLRCHGQHAFPVHIRVHIINGIPLSRFVFPQPVVPLFKPFESPETLSLDFRAPLESVVLI